MHRDKLSILYSYLSRQCAQRIGRIFAYNPIIPAIYRTKSQGSRIIIYHNNILIFREIVHGGMRISAANIGYFAMYYANGNIAIQRGELYIEWIYTAPIPYIRATFRGHTKIKVI